MKKLFFVTVFLAILVFTAPFVTEAAEKKLETLIGVDGQYDTHPILLGMAGLEKLQSITRSTALVKVTFKVSTLPNVLGVPEGIEREFTQNAIGVLKDRYLLTVAHVAKTEPLTVQTPFRIVTVPVHILKTKYFFTVCGKKFEMQPVKIDESQDWALFEIPEESRQYQYPFLKIGKSSELMIGHFIYLVGGTFDSSSHLLRNGIIQATNANLTEMLPNMNTNDAFTVSGGIYPGDSGGIIIALRDGELELVGIINSTVTDAVVGYALKINPLLEKIKAVTGIDLNK